jgi:ribosomal-protein-alanine N-acetyltransferase
MIKFLEGRQVYLRPLTIEDASDIYLKWLNDPEVTRGLASGYFPTTQQELINYVNGALRDQNTVFFALCEKESNLHIGNVKVDRIDWIAQTCELGLIIGEESARGRGIGFESMNLVIQYIFDELNLNKITLAVFENNPGALKLYEKLGFQVEGRFVNHVFKEGRLWDKIYLSLFNPKK